MHLSKADKQIMQLYSDGMKSYQIAMRLEFSPKTVEHYTARIKRKLKAQTIPHAVAIAMRERIIE